MIVTADQDELIAQQRNAVEFGVAGFRDIDAELGLPPEHGFCDPRGRMIEDLDPVVGIPRRILLNDARQVMHARGRNTGDGRCRGFAGLRGRDR